MSLVTNLLALYSGLILINCAIAAALWARNRVPLYRALFLVWAANTLSFVAQGAFQQNAFWLTVGFSSVFVLNVTLARLLELGLGAAEVRWRRFVVVLGAALVWAAFAYARRSPFLVVSLPTAVAVTLPLLVTSARVARHRWATLTTSGKVLILACVVFCAHNVDFAFLRDVPEMAPLGFTIAILIIFALSISAPAVVLEVVTQQQARTAAEMETARRIQLRLLPKDSTIGDLEVACFMKPADDVGGDYFDTYDFGTDSWFFVGDVTGHGLGAGLVMLMAQSTISSILHARPGIAPCEVNYLANRILCANLARLGEQRHMTIASLRRVGKSGTFVVSGSHDNIYVVRGATGRVDAIALNHFPIGVGFVADLGANDFREEEIDLAAGDLLFLGTDGIVEAAEGGDPRAGVFGEERLVELLRVGAARPLDDVRRSVVAALDRFTRGVYLDDVSFVLLRARAQTSGAR